MSTTDVQGQDGTGRTELTNIDTKVEVIVIHVADVNRAKEFYERLGWRLDVTPFREGGREALAAKPVPGRPPKLSGAQIARLYEMIVG